MDYLADWRIANNGVYFEDLLIGCLTKMYISSSKSGFIGLKTIKTESD